MAAKRPYRVRQGAYDPTRSVRISTAVWTAAGQRARKEGLTMSRLIALLTEGYALGIISAPEMRLVPPADAPMPSVVRF